MLSKLFFAQDPCRLAQALLGKVIFVKYLRSTISNENVSGSKFRCSANSESDDIWLTARIIETEAYFLEDKASHASLGYTLKRKALFMPAGTIYMYYARGKDSFNVSAEGPGNAVLIKSAYPYIDQNTHPDMLTIMQQLNPTMGDITLPRPLPKLCKGQTLLCKSLGLTVKQWDQKTFDPDYFFIKDVHYQPSLIMQTTRLGIPKGRDEHLPYRFIDHAFAKFTTEPRSITPKNTVLLKI